MDKPNFHDEISLAEAAESLAKQAMHQGMLNHFTIYFYPDSWQFHFSGKPEGELLTPEEAYLYLKKLLGKTNPPTEI
ncbi:MAG: hypothetical protein HC890_14905 [Chloroflexaceae bacterium]|nr:hypothetical protein [Chloroflexaceae bacterium]